MKFACTCNNKGQDALHGKGVRVGNATTKRAPDGQVAVRCTVCGKEVNVKKD